MEANVLLIEDDPIAARLVELQLGSTGCRVLSALDGLRGLKLAHANPPDLILLDLMLPGLDGFEVLSRLRADPQTADVPVVVVSAKSQATDKQTAARLGADAYLTKPYDWAELRALIHSLLSERPEKAAVHGTCVLLVGSHGGEATPVTLYTGLALTGKGEATTVVDFRPFSIEHSLLLAVAPRPAPVSLSDPGTMAQLPGLTVLHPGGLRLLNNLEGSGEVGQLTPEDVRAVLDVLLAEGGFVLADLPLYPINVMHKAAACCTLLLLVIRSDPTSLAATRAAITLMQRAGAEAVRTGVVFVGPPAEGCPTELEQAVMGVVPAEAGPDAPAFRALADRLRDLR